MLGGAVARRYARALFEVARDADRIDAQEGELKRVLGTFAENPSLQAAFESAKLPLERKKAVLREVFGDLAGPTLNLLLLLADKQREAILPQIAEAYGEIADAERGIVTVEVRSAVEFGEAELRALEDRLKAGGARGVRFIRRVDPELLGGLVLRVGDRLYDGSVRTRLARLRERLARG